MKEILAVKGKNDNSSYETNRKATLISMPGKIAICGENGAMVVLDLNLAKKIAKELEGMVILSSGIALDEAVALGVH